MIYAKHLCQMPHVRKGGESSLHKLIFHESKHMNALQEFSLNLPLQDLM